MKQYVLVNDVIYVTEYSDGTDSRSSIEREQIQMRVAADLSGLYRDIRKEGYSYAGHVMNTVKGKDIKVGWIFKETMPFPDNDEATGKEAVACYIEHWFTICECIVPFNN